MQQFRYKLRSIEGTMSLRITSVSTIKTLHLQCILILTNTNINTKKEREKEKENNNLYNIYKRIQ